MNAEILQILIDTNILIGLEDNKEIDRSYAEFAALCSSNQIALCVHESAIDDINRDLNIGRRNISLSKLAKYKQVSRSPYPEQAKEEKFGLIKSPNDDVDTDLLVTLHQGVTSLLITEDNGIHARVKTLPLGQKVMRVQEALLYFQELFEPQLVEYPHVIGKTCNQLYTSDSFFDSLRADYDGEFDDWLKKCISKERECWVIEKNATLSGLIIYKTENRANEGDAVELEEQGVLGDKVLKLCLFKMSDALQGGRYGEQLLKVAMDYAFQNKFDSIYLTAFPKHIGLVQLLEKFGFSKCGVKGDEYVYSKRTGLSGTDEQTKGFEFHQAYWPSIAMADTTAYIIPVVPIFHDRLFPEIAESINPQMGFPEFGAVESPVPGNAIRKVYVCNATINAMERGSILVFYRSRDSVLTSIGVLESFDITEDIEELKKLVSNRSVYTSAELQSLIQKRAVKVLNFYYARNLQTVIPLSLLKDFGILTGPPQSISRLKPESFERLIGSLEEKDREIFHGS